MITIMYPSSSSGYLFVFVFVLFIALAIHVAVWIPGLIVSRIVRQMLLIIFLTDC